MRIIGGKYRSRVLAAFPGTDVRPTADRVKESLFGILSLKIYGARALDLFCGSGALGLECLSRGAREVVFNDVSRESLKLLEKNMKSLGIEKGGEAKVYNLDYSAFLDAGREPFDLIFLDPPYRLEYGLPALSKIAARGCFRTEAPRCTSGTGRLREKCRRGWKNTTSGSTEKPG